MRNKKLHRWRWGIETFMERKDEIVVTKTKSGYGISFTQKGFNAPKNVLNFSGGTTEVKSLFGDKKLFDFPKSTSYLRRLISIGASAGDIILDFFSGSATTAHAVMQLNAEDGGKRRHIMVQLPEPCDEKSEAFKAGYKTIAEIGKERIRRAGKKILEEWQAKQSSSTELLKLETEHSGGTAPDVGFRVLKVDSSNMADVYYQPDELTQDGLMLQVDNLKPDRKPEDLLFQVLLDWGVDLALPITEEAILQRRVFFVADNALAACFDTGLDEDFVKELAKRQPLRAVFRDSGYASDAVKINFEQIFKALSPHTELKTL
jgi:adenine-specific DNA-methyltransferase